MAYRLTRLADADLVEVAEYTVRQWGELQAAKYAKDFLEAFEKIGQDPLSPGSRARGDLLPGCRVLIINSHFVIYRERDKTTEILRVLHQRMNLPLHTLS